MEVNSTSFMGPEDIGLLSVIDPTLSTRTGAAALIMKASFIKVKF